MESSEEMMTPRATAWEVDEEERKAAAAEVLVGGPSGRRGGRRGEHGREGDLFVCMGSMQTEWRTASNGDVLWQMNTKFECDGAKTIFLVSKGKSHL